MRLFILSVFLFFSEACLAVPKTWNGGAAGSWSVATNWSPVGVPAVATDPATGDDIIFDGSIAATITITDYPAQLNTDRWGSLSIINNATVNISSASDTYMFFGTGLNIAAGSRINIGAATATIFEFGNRSAVLNSGLIYGTVELKGTGTNATTNRKYYTTAGRTRLYGTLIISGPSATLSPFVNSANFYIESGGELQWARDGSAATISSFSCLNGGVMNITGIVTTAVIFSNGGTYAGLINWNCPLQTAQRISIVPQVYPLIFNVDSVRVINTGTGSATLGSQPSYNVGHLEVQGGTMYLGSPVNASHAGAILTDIKLTGGTLISNATFATDATAAYPLTIPVGRDLIITGGTFNLTNRPTGLAPGGAMQLNVARNISQTGGSLLATSSFGSQNNINMSGSGAQTLAITNNFTDVSLSITNTSATLGVTLANNVTIQPSSAFILNRGYVKLDNYNLNVPASLFFQNSFTPMPKIVTNGFGKLKLSGIAASSTKVFPVAPFAVNSYDPLTITTTAAAATNDYSVRVQRGIASGNIYSTKVINRTWIVNGANTSVANAVGLSYQYNDSAKQAACTSTAQMEEGHFAGGVWNVDPVSTLITPSGANPYTVGPFYPNSIDSSFAIGNLASILALENDVQLSAQKNTNSSTLKWMVNNATQIKQYRVERAADGKNFTALSFLNAGNFTYNDMQLLPGLNYYRIRMIDIDGRSYYSNIATVLNAASGTEFVAIAPNPVTGSHLNLQIASAVAGKMNVVIADIQGRVISTQNINLIAGFNAVVINVSPIMSGTYAIYGMADNGRTKVLRFVKQ